MSVDSRKRRSLLAAIKLLKSISHPVRLSLLCELEKGELTVNELIQSQSDISQSQVSQFLLKMKAQGLLESRKESRNVYYRIKSDAARKLIQALYKIFCG